MNNLHIKNNMGVEVQLISNNDYVCVEFGPPSARKNLQWCTTVRKEHVGEMIKWLIEWYIEHDSV